MYKSEKNLAPIKIKSALLTPPPQKKNPKTRNSMGMEVFPQKERNFPGAHKVGAAIPAPELRAKNLRTRGFFSE